MYNSRVIFVVFLWEGGLVCFVFTLLIHYWNIEHIGNKDTCKCCRSHCHKKNNLSIKAKNATLSMSNYWISQRCILSFCSRTQHHHSVILDRFRDLHEDLDLPKYQISVSASHSVLRSSCLTSKETYAG